MTHESQSTLVVSGIVWPALRNHIACMADINQLALGAFMSSLGVKGLTKSWDAPVRDHQFGENASRDIGKSQRLRKEGNATIYMVSAMRPGLAKKIEKVHIWSNVESPETDLDVAANGCCIDYTDTWSSRWLHRLSESKCTNHSTTYYGCEHMLEFGTGVACTSLPIMRIPLQVAQESQIWWLQAILLNTGWMDNHQVCHGSAKVIQVLDSVDVEKPYCYSVSHPHGVKWHVRSYGWHHVSCSWEEDSMERRLVLCHEVCTTEVVQIVCWSCSTDVYACHFSTYSSSFLEVAII